MLLRVVKSVLDSASSALDGLKQTGLDSSKIAQFAAAEVAGVAASKARHGAASARNAQANKAFKKKAA